MKIAIVTVTWSDRLAVLLRKIEEWASAEGRPEGHRRFWTNPQPDWKPVAPRQRDFSYSAVAGSLRLAARRG